MGILRYFNARKGQSAIEYLMSYGWMLLVVAVIGGAIFSVVQGQNVESSSGFTGSGIQIEDFGLTSNDTFDLNLRNMNSEPLEIKNIEVTDGQDTINWNGSANIPVTDTNIISLENISEADSTNNLDVTITYDRGNLPDIQTSGEITGNYKVVVKNSTISSDVNTPTVKTVKATDIKTNKATLNGNITDTGGEVPEVRFNFGTNQDSLSNTTELGTISGEFSKTVTGLNSDSKYYFEVEANNTAGTAKGENLNFTTKASNFIDTFNDGDYNGWTVLNGSWKASNNQLEDESGTAERVIERNNVNIEPDRLDAEFDFRLNSMTQFQSGHFYPVYVDSNNYINVYINEAGSYQANIVQNGTNILDLGSGYSQWGGDTNWHSGQLLNNNGTWELYLDGNVILSGTPSEKVTISGPTRIRVSNGDGDYSKTYDWDNINVNSEEIVTTTWDDGSELSSSSSGAYSKISDSSIARNGTELIRYEDTNDDAWVEPTDVVGYGLGETFTQSMRMESPSSTNSAGVLFDVDDASLSSVLVRYRNNNGQNEWHLVDRGDTGIKDSFTYEASADTWYDIQTRIRPNGSVVSKIYESGSQIGVLSTSNSITDGSGETLGFNINTANTDKVWFDSVNKTIS